MLNRQDFFFFRPSYVLEFLYVLIGQLLDFVQSAALFVFRKLFRFEMLFHCVVSVPTYVADGGPVIFKDFVDVFSEVSATLFVQSWDWDTNQAAVIGGIEAEIRSLN